MFPCDGGEGLVDGLDRHAVGPHAALGHHLVERLEDGVTGEHRGGGTVQLDEIESVVPEVLP